MHARVREMGGGGSKEMSQGRDFLGGFNTEAAGDCIYLRAARWWIPPYSLCILATRNRTLLETALAEQGWEGMS
jgi:hypothetical protein